ncbi:protein GVQW3-like [Anabrus simplex]|uniref:protein GVQW3-like n=1 Tax=Anabrus simplex TaxID=316456 RepID=UPI0035A307C3
MATFSLREQRAIIRFLNLRGVTPIEIHRQLKETCGDGVMDVSKVRSWVRQFNEGRTSCDNKPKQPRARTSRSDDMIEKVERIVLGDRRITVEQIASSVDISVGSVHTILHDDLKMRKVPSRWVPRMLTDDHKAARVACCQAMLTRNDSMNGTFFSSIVTMDETWTPFFNPETKRQSAQWKHTDSPPPKKFRVSASAEKMMMSMFWDSKGVILTHCVPKGTTEEARLAPAFHLSAASTHWTYTGSSGLGSTLVVIPRTPTADVYARLAIQPVVLPFMNSIPGGVFQQDDARPHAAVVTQRALNSFDIVPWPARSPDLTPIEHVSGIIGRQLQRHPQPALTVPIFFQPSATGMELHPAS